MNRFRSERSTLVVLTLLVGVVASGCVKPDAPTVGINKIEASLVFGVKPPPETVVNPLAESVMQADNLDDIDFTFPDAKLPDFSLPTFIDTKPACPDADPTAAPEVATEVTITGEVPVGISRWKLGGFFTPQAGATPFGGANSFEQRIVRRVKKASPTLYTFEVAQGVLGVDKIVVSTYQVNTAAIKRNPSDGVGVISTPSVGEPERGIVLKRQAVVDARGTETAVFQPTTGLLLLPLPVTSGEVFQSAAVDPRSGQTIVHRSTVTRRQRIDACGDLVDGWLVESERTVTGNPQSSTGNSTGFVSQIFATQYGGVPIQERFKANSGCPVGPCDLTATLGQLHPSPLPPGNE